MHPSVMVIFECAKTRVFNSSRQGEGVGKGEGMVWGVEGAEGVQKGMPWGWSHLTFVVTKLVPICKIH